MTNSNFDNEKNESILANSENNFSEFDELLANPFDEEETTPDYIQSLNEAEIKANRQVTTEDLIHRLPEHRQVQARNLSKKIDENNMGAVLAYGSNAQRKLSEFSRQILSEVQIKDTGEIGESISELMNQLQITNPQNLTQNQNFFSKIFNRVKESANETQLKYQKIGSQIDRIAIRLEREKNELINDNNMLEIFYNKNKEYFEALNVYIAAGELKMQELQNEIIPAAIQKAKDTNDQMEVQKVHDLNQFLDRLDKRTHDLRITRQMTIQQAPQIRMIQNTNQALAEKIHVSIHTAIPLWENQITIALALLRQKNAVVSQKLVSDTTNDLLLKNSEMLKQGAVDVAREAERGIVDLETLQTSQRNLVNTLKETLEIQETGRAQRRLAEKELQAMEEELRTQLLEISNRQQNSELLAEKSFKDDDPFDSF